MESSQGLYASGQMFSTANQYTSMANVYSPRRAAAMAIDVIASDRARLATLQQVLDVKIDGGKAQSALHEIAESLREQDTYGFAIAEIVFDPFSARERMMNQLSEADRSIAYVSHYFGSSHTRARLVAVLHLHSAARS